MNIKPRKSLGQNFLRSRGVIDTMIEAGKVDSRDIIVEAGPGKGILTEALLSCARQVIAIEKDPRLVMYLSLKFKREISEGRLEIIEGDTLEFNPAREQLQSGGYKIVANIPYYLTGQFLRYFLSHPTSPSLMVLLLQKEVAQRIIARNKKESILSLSVKAYGTPVYVQTVPAAQFSPKPNVDSAVLLINDVSKRGFRRISEDRFFEVLRVGFSKKRKKLISNLSALASRETLARIFKDLALDENARAEDVPLYRWKQLTRALT